MTHPTPETHWKYVVSGGGGFIGSHLVDALLASPATSEVRVLDNFSSGRREHLVHHAGDSRLKIHTVDLLEAHAVVPLLGGVDVVVHLAANPDIRWGLTNTRLDLDQETIVTYNVLEAMRLNQVKRILFSSSCAVYGDIGTEPAHEGRGPSLPPVYMVPGSLDRRVSFRHSAGRSRCLP